MVLGASGATGRKLVDQLLQNGQQVKLIVRSPSRLPEAWQKNKQVAIIQANASELKVAEMGEHLKDCHAVASCLGHNLNLKGIYGKPRKLVTDTIILVCEAIQKNGSANPTRVILMNTAGNRNRDLNEPLSMGERLVIASLRLILPPHPDNEQAADYLRIKVGQQNPSIEWVVVRPDTLVEEAQVSKYETYPSPIRSALFNPGKTSRINVGHFMARLITDSVLWNEWKGQMPVLYNKNAETAH